MQQLRMFSMISSTYSQFVRLLKKGIEGLEQTGFFAFKLVSLTTFMLSMIFFELFIYKVLMVAIFLRKFVLEKEIYLVCDYLVQLTGFYMVATLAFHELKSDEQSCNQFFSKYTRKVLANVGPRGESIATPSICFIAQKMEFFIQDFFSKYDQIGSFLLIWSHLLNKFLMENFIFSHCLQNLLLSVK